MRRVLILLAMASGWTHPGCTATRDWLNSLNENDDPAVRHEDEWVEQTGLEARGDRPREMSTEPRWFREFTMSERARSIERNVGIYD
jgi:hypothetical protein